jgi:hypothetical protein
VNEKQPKEEIKAKHEEVSIIDVVVLLLVVFFPSKGSYLDYLIHLKECNCCKACAYAWNHYSWGAVKGKHLHGHRHHKAHKVENQLPIENFRGQLKLEINDVPDSVVCLNVFWVLFIEFEHQVSNVYLCNRLVDYFLVLVLP